MHTLEMLLKLMSSAQLCPGFERWKSARYMPCDATPKQNHFRRDHRHVPKLNIRFVQYSRHRLNECMCDAQVTYPLDTLRLRLAVDPAARSLKGASRVLFREGSYQAYFRGLGPSLIGDRSQVMQLP